MNNVAGNQCEPWLVATCSVDPSTRWLWLSTLKHLSPTPKRNGRVSNPFKLRVEDGGVAVVCADKDSIAIDTRYRVVAEGDVLRALKGDGTRLLQTPISSTRHAVWVHERIRSVAKCDPRDMNVLHRIVLCPRDVDQHLHLR